MYKIAAIMLTFLLFGCGQSGIYSKVRKSLNDDVGSMSFGDALVKFGEPTSCFEHGRIKTCTWQFRNSGYRISSKFKDQSLGSVEGSVTGGSGITLAFQDDVMVHYTITGKLKNQDWNRFN